MTNLIRRRNQFNPALKRYSTHGKSHIQTQSINPALKQLLQSIKRYALMSAFASLLPSLTFAACLPFDQARNHLDETQCVTGKVIRVQEGDRGVHYLDFCEDYRLCTFTVVVFAHDLQKVGDIRQLVGKVVEIKGEIKDYDDRAEIVLESSRQLGNGLVRLSPLPKS